MSTTTTTATTDRDALAAEAYNALLAADGNATKAAAELGLPRTTFRALITRAKDNLAALEQAIEAGEVAAIAGQAESEPTTEAEALEAGIANAIEAGEMTVFEPTTTDEPATTDEPSGPATDAEPVVTDEPKPAKPAKTRKAKAAKADKQDDFPAGVLPPVAFRHLLVAEGLAPETLRTQAVYNWLHAKKAPFPVKHFDGQGIAHDTAEPGTRPGVQVDAAKAWYAAHIAK